MTTAYIIQRLPPYDDAWYSKTLRDIDVQNPDCIIVISISELGSLIHLEEFFQKIESWLYRERKTLYVLWPGPDTKLKPYIQAIKTAGNLIGNYACVFALTLYNLKFNIDNASKLFTCYNNNPKYHRKLLVDELVNHNLINQGVVTYHYPDRLTEIPYHWKYHDGSRLYDEEDYSINNKLEYTPGFLARNYFTGFIDVVTETNYDNQHFFPTEKTAKPLGSMKPYMALSSKHYHRNLLSEFGYEMYDEIFDYAFDNCDTVEDRMMGIIDNLKNIQGRFLSNRHEIYESVSLKLEKNRNAALNMIDTVARRKKLIPDSMRFLLKEDTKLLGEISPNIPEVVDRNWYLERMAHKTS